ncbi:11025_t:CDS:2, partial [Cetraspora pellucida]
MKFITSYLLILFVIFNVANSHYQLQNPPTRGFDESTEPNSPCGGFNSVNASAITKFPVSQGRATSYFYDGDGTLTYFYALTSNSTFLPVS